jgi:hypothetical protein
MTYKPTHQLLVEVRLARVPLVKSEPYVRYAYTKIERRLDQATPSQTAPGGEGNRTKKFLSLLSLRAAESLSIRILTYTPCRMV